MRDVWSLFAHLLGVAGFLLAHGTSAGLAFAMRRERDPERMRRLLQLSQGSFNVLYAALLVLLAAGVVGGFRGNYWGFGWIWTALALLVVTAVVMSVLAGRWYGALRKALGIKYRTGLRIYPAPPAGTDEDVHAAASRLQPFVMAGVGVVAVVLILFLMIDKPF